MRNKSDYLPGGPIYLPRPAPFTAFFSEEHIRRCNLIHLLWDLGIRSKGMFWHKGSLYWSKV